MSPRLGKLADEALHAEDLPHFLLLVVPRLSLAEVLGLLRLVEAERQCRQREYYADMEHAYEAIERAVAL